MTTKEQNIYLSNDNFVEETHCSGYPMTHQFEASLGDWLIRRLRRKKAQHGR